MANSFQRLEDLARILRGVGVIASRAAADSTLVRRLTESDYSVVLRTVAATQRSGATVPPQAATSPAAISLQQEQQQRQHLGVEQPHAVPPPPPQAGAAEQQLDAFVQSRLHVPPPAAHTEAPPLVGQPELEQLTYPGRLAQVAASAQQPSALQPLEEPPTQRSAEPAVHGLQGVTLIQPEQQPQLGQQPSQQATARPEVPAATAAVAAPPPRKFKPRERSVPSSSLGRVAGFAGLGASLLYGTMRESVSRAFRSPSADQASSSFLTEQNAERLANALCRMRGAALKIGQMLSIQDENVLPPQFQAALERVRAGADVMPRKQLEQVLREELGPDWRQRVADFDYTPLAAASIGQVHGVITHDGRRGAMKIQYPGVARSIESDVDNLMRLISIANILPKGLYVENAVKVAKRELALECDYRYELEAQRRFKQLIASDPYTARHFVVPDVFPELSGERVLTTEWVPGVHIDRVADMPQEVRNAVGTRLLKLTLKELFHWRYMQTDPNFGNFLYDAPTDKLYLIDFGAARHYSRAFVDEYLLMVKGCAERDSEEVIRRSTKLGFLTGDESRVMLDAHVEAGFAVGVPFGSPGIYDFGQHGPLTRRVTELGAIMLKHRLTPPPDESYSLHRKLSGAFLACIRLKAQVPCNAMFYETYNSYLKGQLHEQAA
ncbi:hypothetical protein N2152v2_006242 [Parachlorella kessleri]